MSMWSIYENYIQQLDIVSTKIHEMIDMDTV